MPTNLEPSSTTTENTQTANSQIIGNTAIRVAQGSIASRIYIPKRVRDIVTIEASETGLKLKVNNS